MVQPRAGHGAVQIALRLPVELRDEIKRVADERGRSMNSQIVHMLQQTVGIVEGTHTNDGPYSDVVGQIDALPPDYRRKVLAVIETMLRSV